MKKIKIEKGGDLSDVRLVMATYGVPGIMGIENLFALGMSPNQIGLLTYNHDEQNQILWDFAHANQIETMGLPARSDDAFNWVYNQRPNALFSLYYRQKLPSRILNVPSLGCVNLHPSLLPEYRGCFSAPWSIINGEKTSGFTYHHMTEQFDKGNIILQKTVPIQDNETAFSLFHKLIVQGLGSFEIALEKIVKNHDPGVPQSQGGSYYPRKIPHDGEIDIQWSADRIERFIRAMYYPPHKGAIIKIADKEYEVNSMNAYKEVIQQHRDELK